jgi:hypothetical protein
VTAADATADLVGLETAPGDPLILTVNLDDRPLRGLTGWVDWRTGGLISDLVIRGAICAADFHLGIDEIRTAFGGRVVVYG